MEEVIQTGYDGYYRGEYREDNPYEDDRRELWFRGWDAAEDEDNTIRRELKITGPGVCPYRLN